MTEILKQGQYSPLPVEKQIVIIFAGTNGYLDDLEIEDCQPFEQGLYEFMDSSYPSVGSQIIQKKQIDEPLRAEIRKMLDEYKAKFLAERKAKAAYSGSGPFPPCSRERDEGWRPAARQLEKALIMATLLDIRRRIRSVKSTQQITRAMKMVAAARLRRAQDGIFNARPYANEMLTLLASLAARTEQRAHPLLAERPIEKVLLVLITADRGLCGAFNANLIRAAQDYLEVHHDQEVSIIAVGRKGRDVFRKQPGKMLSEHINLFGHLKFSHAQQIAKEIIDLYTQQKVDAVDFLYNAFKSIMTQRVVIERYLPVKPLQPAAGEALIDYIYEQPAPEIFNSLLPRYLETEVYRVLLESQAAELAARMTAMDAATNNASDLIESLTLHLNRVRQAAITREIIEVVSGAAAT